MSEIPYILVVEVVLNHLVRKMTSLSIYKYILGVMVYFVYTRGLGSNTVFRKLVVQVRAAEYFLFDCVSKTDLEVFQPYLTYLDREHSAPIHHV